MNMTGKKRKVNDTRNLSEVLAVFCEVARNAGEVEKPADTPEAKKERREDRVLLLRSDAHP